jgi:hypothetical protein
MSYAITMGTRKLGAKHLTYAGNRAAKRRPGNVSAWLASILCAGLAAASSQPALAADDGARAYRLAPDGTQAIALFGLGTRGNTSVDTGTILANADLDVNIALPMYVTNFSLGGQAATVGVTLPIGEVKGQVQAGPNRLTAKDSGIGDLGLFAIVGLHNMPSLKPEAYVTHKAGLAVALMGMATVPTGHYSSARPLNVGANRWSFRASMPMTLSLTDTYVDPKYASIELMPSVTFYTTNNDVYGPAGRQSQSPLFMQEGHVTRNLSPKTFVSFDALVIHGGSTKTDGISNNDRKSGLGIGATIATMISSSVELRATYGASVARNATGIDTKMLRVGLTKVL